ncbi:hypothetical protein C8J57DRAFT_1729830 [Mycena rebaudengoi]|nr:hypothetical protein C8J57DRAFT_1729830 [Mycena rebaudengoi]
MQKLSTDTPLLLVLGGIRVLIALVLDGDGDDAEGSYDYDEPSPVQRNVRGLGIHALEISKSCRYHSGIATPTPCGTNVRPYRNLSPSAPSPLVRPPATPDVFAQRYHEGRSAKPIFGAQSTTIFRHAFSVLLLLQSRLKRARPDNPTDPPPFPAMPPFPHTAPEGAGTKLSLPVLPRVSPPPSASASASASTTSPPPPLASSTLVKCITEPALILAARGGDVDDAGGVWRLGKHDDEALGTHHHGVLAQDQLRDILRGDAGRANSAKRYWSGRSGWLHIALGGFGVDVCGLLVAAEIAEVQGPDDDRVSPGPIPADPLRTPPPIGRAAAAAATMTTPVLRALSRILVVFPSCSLPSRSCLRRAPSHLALSAARDVGRRCSSLPASLHPECVHLLRQAHHDLPRQTPRSFVWSWVEL